MSIPQIMMMMMMWMIMYSIKFKTFPKPQTLSPFECGYSTLTSKLPMSIQFTLLAFVFLIFDIELSILISANWKSINMNMSWMITMALFLLSLTISIIYEMTKKSLKWILY